MSAPTPLAPAAAEIVRRLALEPHPEGGFYRETHRSTTALPADALPEGFDRPRAACTCIVFLLPAGARSAWHRVRGEELWLHQAGDPLALRLCGGDRPDGRDSAVHTITLGTTGDAGASPQAVVPAGWWQDAEPITPRAGAAGYTLVGCVVVPGFDFADFELLDRGG